MTFSSFLLILRRQFISKWGRFLLASGGIMIGIWAITLTSGLSFGLSDTIIKAINSQPAAKEFTLSRTPSGQTSFFDITEAPTFKALSQKDFDQIKSKNPAIYDIAPITSIDTFVANNSAISCSAEFKKIDAKLKVANLNPDGVSAKDNAELDKLSSELADKCPPVSISAGVFRNFYETNKTKWIGKTEAPKVGEIATCFKCGSADFSKIFNVSEPKDLLGKEISLEFTRAPEFYISGEEIKVDAPNDSRKSLSEPFVKTFKIVSVVDDRELNPFGFSNVSIYIDYSYFSEAIKIANPQATNENIGYLQASVVLNSYEDLESTINSLKADGYLPVSFTLEIISGIKTTFAVLTAVLSGFGLIALIASVFGIINVMTISVLERKKEIGILKSLGARDGDIFNLFLIESALLGFIGWLMGTILAYFSGLIISFVFFSIATNDPNWKSSLDSLNITSFAPSFPWWLLGGTLLLALFFTIISGVFPATKAGKQNPVEVLRSE